MSRITRELPLEALSLGRFHAEHPVCPHDYGRAAFGSALMVAICAAMIFVATRAKDTSALYVAAIVFALPGLVFGCLLVTHIRRRVRRVLVLDRGFVVDHGSHAVAFPWAEINSVREIRSEVIAHGGYHVESVLEVKRRDGKSVRLNTHYRDADALFEMIQATVLERLLPKAREALEAGRPVGFGPVRLTTQGFDDGGLQLLPWVEFAGFTVDKAFLTIRKRGQKYDWFSRALRDIPNARVLVALLQAGPNSLGVLAARLPPPAAPPKVMTAKKQDAARFYLGSFAFLGLLQGPGGGYLTWQQYLLHRRGTATPSEIRLEDLARGGRPANVHVRVTDFSPGPKFVIDNRHEQGQNIFIPLFPRGAEPRGGLLKVVLKSSKVKNEEGVRSLRAQNSITGVIVNDIDNIGWQQKAELSSLYPFADVDSALLLAHDYSFPTTTRLALYAAGSAALVLAGLASAVGSVMLALKPKPRQFPFLSRG